MKREYWKWQWISFIQFSGIGVGIFISLIIYILKYSIPIDVILTCLIPIFVFSVVIGLCCCSIGYISSSTFVFCVFSLVKFD